ncbi:MAG: SDR family oxidoreductase [Betaproteobacteria bacterium]|jgi:gluconate 5-dehydrogenase
MNANLAELFRLDGRVAMVTGGNSGIGRTMALALAEAGADIVVVGRDRERLAAVSRDVRALGRRACEIQADLSDRGENARVAREAVDGLGSPDILVCAAGINERPSMTVLDEGVWDRTMRLNLDSPFLLARLLAPEMARRGWGRIINLASLQSVRSFNNSGAYGVSKAGVAQLTRTLAEAWSPRGVNCNAIAPGFFPTPLTRAVFDDPERARGLAARTMIGRNGELEDIRGITVFLASHASDYITGQVLFVDGGFSAG